MKGTANRGHADYLEDNDVANSPVELTVPQDGMRRLATVDVDKGATFSENLVAVLNLGWLRVPAAKQVLKTVGLVRGIVYNEGLVAGTQITTGNAVNVTQPDSEDSGDSEDSASLEGFGHAGGPEPAGNIQRTRDPEPTRNIQRTRNPQPIRIWERLR